MQGSSLGQGTYFLSHLVTADDQLHGVANKEEDYDEDERESRPRVPLLADSQPLPAK